MNEKKGLTKREKFLIFFASAIALFYVAVQFGITPARENHTQKQDDLASLQDQEDSMRLTLDGEASIRRINENTKTEFDEVTAQYPELMSSEELQRHINELCGSVSLNPVSFSTDPRRWEALVIQRVATEEEESAEEAPSLERKRGTAEDMKTASFVVAQVSVTAEGSLANLKRLFDTVNGIGNITITGVTLPLRSETSDGRIPVTLEVIMRKS